VFALYAVGQKSIHGAYIRLAIEIEIRLFDHFRKLEVAAQRLGTYLKV